MNKTILSIGAALLVTLQASAQVLITTEYSPTLSGGSDNAGLVGSIFSFAILVDDSAPYVDYEGFGVGAAPILSTTVTVTGTTGGINDGVFSLSSPETLWAIPTDTVGGAYVATNTESVELPLNTVTITYALLEADSVPAGESVSIGDPVLPSHFDGAALRQTVTSVSDLSATYNLGNGGVLEATAVPEPSFYATLFGALTLAWAWRRRR